MGVYQPFRLTLGSASVGRRYLLEQAGYHFDVRPAHIDEPTDAGYPNARQLVGHIAWLKAEAVAPHVEGGVLLTADTVAWLDGQVIGKPRDEADARRILRFLGGREHELWTGVCLWRRPDDVQLAWQERSLVLLRRMGDAELDDYLASREWENNSGAYAIKEADDPHVRVVEGSVSNVIGMPMETLGRVLPWFARGASITMGGRRESPEAPGPNPEAAMTAKPDPRPWPDVSQFHKNNANVPLEVLLPYVNQHVAWSLDGTRIVASAADLGELIRHLREAGVALDQVVLDFVSDPDVSWL